MFYYYLISVVVSIVVLVIFDRYSDPKNRMSKRDASRFLAVCLIPGINICGALALIGIVVLYVGLHIIGAILIFIRACGWELAKLLKIGQDEL